MNSTFQAIHPIPFFLKKPFFIQFLFIGIGFIPVTCIALNVFQIIPLHISSWSVALPAYLAMMCIGCIDGKSGSRAFKGWVAGIVAVALYDCARVPFIIAGWEDFIPKIGDWIFNREGTHKIIGYAWRYIGNGGGMGIAFFFLVPSEKSKKEYLGKGILFGLFVFSCLMLVLLLSSNGEIMMFQINVLTFTGSLLGHIIYGIVLGILINCKGFKLE